jgi:hypothetical protein
MEVQSPQSVQINFNNKIITLHNVTIVKNPKIITLDASQYSNLLKGSSLKLAQNGGTIINNVNPASPAAGLLKSTPVKTQLVPVKTSNSTPNNVIKQIPKLGVLQLKSSPTVAVSTANGLKLQSVPVVKSSPTVVVNPPKNVNNVTTPMKVQLKPFQANSFVIKPPAQSVAKTSAKVVISPPQKRKLETSPTTLQPESKKACNNLPFSCIFCKDAFEDSNMLIEHMKNIHPESLKVPVAANETTTPKQNGIDSISKEITKSEVEKKPIMVSNVKLSNLKPIDSAAQQKLLATSPQITKSTPKIVISPKMLENNTLKAIKKSPTIIKANSTTKVIENVVVDPPVIEECKPSTSKDSSPVIQDVKVTSSEEIVETSTPDAIESPVEKIRKKPGRKPKYPDGMKPGEFHFSLNIFFKLLKIYLISVKIKRAYNKSGKYSKLNPTPNGSFTAPDSVDSSPAPQPKKRGRKPKSMMNGNSKDSIKKFFTPKEQNSSTLKENEEPKKDKKAENENTSKDMESSTNNSSDDSDDESEVRDLLMDVEDEQDEDDDERCSSPESPEFEEVYPTASMNKYENDGNGFDYEDYEYCSNIMEPICELSCEDDSDDENESQQDENDEAMRLYREAMEMNYQANGIKKRGRRRKRTKPLMENFNEINGILAGLLEEPQFKVPKGPGRGRRKEMNELELEMERISGACLFSCNKCDETFKYAGDLAKHVRSHTINSPYQVRSS